MSLPQQIPLTGQSPEKSPGQVIDIRTGKELWFSPEQTQRSITRRPYDQDIDDAPYDYEQESLRNERNDSHTLERQDPRYIGVLNSKVVDKPELPMYEPVTVNSLTEKLIGYGRAMLGTEPTYELDANVRVIERRPDNFAPVVNQSLLWQLTKQYTDRQ